MQAEAGEAAVGTVVGPDRRLVPALMLATFVNFLGSLALGPFLPDIADELETSVALVGQVPALLMLVAAALGLLVGPLADRFGYRRLLLTGLMTVVASTLATGLAPTYPLLLLITLVGAVGRAAVQPTAQAIVASRFAEEAARRLAMSRVVIGQSGAAIVGIPLLTFVAGLSSWRLAFFTLAGLALLAVVLAWHVLPRDARAAGGRFGVEQVLASYAPLLRHRATAGLIAAALLGNTGVWIAWSYQAAFLVKEHGFTTAEVGWAYLATGAAVTLGSLLAGGRLGARPRPLMIASQALSGALFAPALLLPVPGAAVTGLVVLAMVATGAYTIGNAMVLTAETPAGRATTMTLNSSALSLGVALGGAFGGLALVVGGYQALGVCAPICSAAAAAIIWSARTRDLPLSSPLG